MAFFSQESIIENITTAFNENSPEMIYFITLYNVFSEFLEDISEDVLPNEATGFKQSKIWSMLYDFQRDAVLAIMHGSGRLNPFAGGCVDTVRNWMHRELDGENDGIGGHWETVY